MPSEHSRLGGSSIHRTLECPGSAVEDAPERTNQAAEDGTIAHGLGERILRGDIVEASEFKDQDTCDAVNEYVDYVRGFGEQYEHDKGYQFLIEQRIVSKSLPDHGGTIDVLFVTDDTLHVIDYKNGVMPVNPVDNKQLLSYLVLADELYPGRKVFRGSIVQPNVYGETECIEFTRDALDEHSLAVELVADDTTLKAGSHCHWCPLAQTCAELKRESTEVVKMQFDDGWDADDCKRVIAIAPALADLAKQAAHRLGEIMMDGEPVEGWKLVRQLANRSWRSEDEMMLACIEKGLDDSVIHVPRKIKSPAQLEKFSSAFKPMVKELSHRIEKGIIAVESSNKAKEYDPHDLFTDLEG